jgi:hypothetical protein
MLISGMEGTSGSVPFFRPTAQRGVVFDSRFPRDATDKPNFLHASVERRAKVPSTTFMKFLSSRRGSGLYRCLFVDLTNGEI